MDGVGLVPWLLCGYSMHKIACFECGGFGGDLNPEARTHFNPRRAAAQSHRSPTGAYRIIWALCPRCDFSH